MKPDWDKLGAMFKDSPSVVIADADCDNADLKAVCAAQEVTGFPTIKYYTESGATVYDGGRDFKALKKFVKKTLKGKERKCDAASKKACLPEELAYFEQWTGKSDADIEKEVSRLAKKSDDVLKTDVRKQVEFESSMLALIQKPKKKKAEL